MGSVSSNVLDRMTRELALEEVELLKRKLETQSKDLASQRRTLEIEESAFRAEREAQEMIRVANNDAYTRARKSIAEQEESVAKLKKLTDKTAKLTNREYQWALADREKQVEKVKEVMREAIAKDAGAERKLKEADTKLTQRSKEALQEAQRQMGEAQEKLKMADARQKVVGDLMSMKDEEIESKRKEWQVEKAVLEGRLGNAEEMVRSLLSENRKLESDINKLEQEKEILVSRAVLEPNAGVLTDFPTSLFGRVARTISGVTSGSSEMPQLVKAASKTDSTSTLTKGQNLSTENEPVQETAKTFDQPDGNPSSSGGFGIQATGARSGTSIGPFFLPIFKNGTQDILTDLLPQGGQMEWKKLEPKIMIVTGREATAEVVKKKLDDNGFDLDIAFQMKEECRQKRFGESACFEEGVKKILICSLATANKLQAHQHAAFVSLAFVTKDDKKAMDTFLEKLYPRSPDMPRPNEVKVYFRKLVEDQKSARNFQESIRNLGVSTAMTDKELSWHISGCIGTIDQDEEASKSTTGLTTQDRVKKNSAANRA